MKIYIPYCNIKKTVQCLDNDTLNEQITNLFKILSIATNVPINILITEEDRKSSSIELWKDNLDFLLKHLLYALSEYTFRTSMQHKLECLLYNFSRELMVSKYKLNILRVWYTTYKFKEIKFLNADFCKGMQEELLEKDYNYYIKYFGI